MKNGSSDKCLYLLYIKEIFLRLSSSFKQQISYMAEFDLSPKARRAQSRRGRVLGARAGARTRFELDAGSCSTHQTLS